MAKRNPYGRVQIGSKWFRVNKNGKPGAELVRCSNTMTEAEFVAWVLSGLRARTKLWQPANEAWKLNTRPKPAHIKGRHRVEHQCVICLQWFPKAKKKSKIIGVQLDHIIPCEGMSDFAKAPLWIARAFVEIDGYQKLCSTCHNIKSQKERKNGDSER